MMSINAVKGSRSARALAAAELSGEENADEMRTGNNGTRFLSNNAGGILGGISTGQPVVCALREADIVDPVAAPHR